MSFTYDILHEPLLKNKDYTSNSNNGKKSLKTFDEINVNNGIYESLSFLECVSGENHKETKLHINDDTGNVMPKFFYKKTRNIFGIKRKRKVMKDGIDVKDLTAMVYQLVKNLRYNVYDNHGDIKKINKQISDLQIQIKDLRNEKI